MSFWSGWRILSWKLQIKERGRGGSMEKTIGCSSPREPWSSFFSLRILSSCKQAKRAYLIRDACSNLSLVWKKEIVWCENRYRKDKGAQQGHKVELWQEVRNALGGIQRALSRGLVELWGCVRVSPGAWQKWGWAHRAVQRARCQTSVLHKMAELVIILVPQGFRELEIVCWSRRAVETAQKQQQLEMSETVRGGEAAFGPVPLVGQTVPIRRERNLKYWAPPGMSVFIVNFGLHWKFTGMRGHMHMSGRGYPDAAGAQIWDWVTSSPYDRSEQPGLLALYFPKWLFLQLHSLNTVKF